MHKSIILVFFLSLILNSCKQEKELKKYDKNGNLIVYDEETYVKMWYENKMSYSGLKVTIIDTSCINQTKRAFKDIKKGKLIHFRSKNPEFEKLSILLRKYGIESKEFTFSCIRMSGFEPYCYQEEMGKEIRKKFGENFIDSLTEVAKRQFVIENPDKPYIEDGIDLREKYNVK